jgi:hypothetical protein
MKRLIVLALGLAFALGPVTTFAQNTSYQKKNKKKGSKKGGGKKAPKRGTGGGTLL